MTARDAWGQVAHDLRILADSIDAAIDTPSREAVGAASPVPPPPAPIQEQHVNTALGVCPVHRTAWTVKDAGVGKNGKPYKAFWKCGGKTDGVYCNQKPVKAWQDSHPITEEVPF